MDSEVTEAQEQDVEAREPFNPNPSIDEMIASLQGQIGELTVQLVAARLSLTKALNRVHELEGEKDEE